jgi:hypothetical protein
MKLVEGMLLIITGLLAGIFFVLLALNDNVKVLKKMQAYISDYQEPVMLPDGNMVITESLTGSGLTVPPGTSPYIGTFQCTGTFTFQGPGELVVRFDRGVEIPCPDDLPGCLVGHTRHEKWTKRFQLNADESATFERTKGATP